MSSGIRATVVFSTPDVCPISRISAITDTVIDNVSASVASCSSSDTSSVPDTTSGSDTDPGDDDSNPVTGNPNRVTGSVTEFVVDTASPPEDLPAELVFSYGDKHLYRLVHDGTVGCPCECLGEFGCPPHRYVARRGTLEIVFHAADYEQLQAVIGELRERFPGTDIRRLVRSPSGDEKSDTVFVDRGKLTDRQLEVLRIAYEKGYFDRPRSTNATELAAELGINQSTFSEHLVAAQTKLLADVFEDGT
ncbi:Transcriptional regulator, contains HTH domain [Halalkaliarchaeum sp. AArc-CO]|uniref:helix-turn-helix domain-containing protein n=1 Tax=unclassified Halalkaliarchaeum TaxID=2678344 RepID=UPI00217CF72D|nr:MULTISPECIES: helix-turn-helix domain-containing protein [unclassified Halalkaliarchaeum]MDR5673432.1 helix-turn-helix domain-containing protein [Halalkaliarchaeum sp. AArc-GB]UWG49893.1 Transcriptional regulator, contains HTH domain [Halalkaliarchaeum sp. AArc-CO]